MDAAKKFIKFLTPDALEYTAAILADRSSKKKEKVLPNPYLFCTTCKSMIASKYEKKIHLKSNPDHNIIWKYIEIINCIYCQKDFGLPPGFAGSEINCPYCKAIIFMEELDEKK
jgi:DNA-directed RNA polymerase subunit RPC12/RpoP